jgi:hypothetical protein
MAEVQILQGDHMAESHVVQHCCPQGQAHGSAWQILERPEPKICRLLNLQVAEICSKIQHKTKFDTRFILFPAWPAGLVIACNGAVLPVHPNTG